VIDAVVFDVGEMLVDKTRKMQRVRAEPEVRRRLTCHMRDPVCARSLRQECGAMLAGQRETRCTAWGDSFRGEQLLYGRVVEDALIVQHPLANPFRKGQHAPPFSLARIRPNTSSTTLALASSSCSLSSRSILALGWFWPCIISAWLSVSWMDWAREVGGWREEEGILSTCPIAINMATRCTGYYFLYVIV